MAIEEDDFFEAVIRERLGDVEHVMLEVREVVVDGAGKIHDVPGVAIRDDRQHEQLVDHRYAGPLRDAAGADEIDVERQMRPMLLDGAARDDADFAHVDGVIDFGPGEFFVAVFSRGAAWHGGAPWSLKTFETQSAQRTQRAQAENSLRSLRTLRF